VVDAEVLPGCDPGAAAGVGPVQLVAGDRLSDWPALIASFCCCPRGTCEASVIALCSMLVSTALPYWSMVIEYCSML
jgi:hypothetical protein